MVLINRSLEEEFILLGFYEYENQQITLLFLFLIAYLLCVTGNMFLIVIILVAPHLHTPMYFFLGNLSFVDICYTSLILPRLMLSFLDMRSISFSGCMLQLYLFIGFVCTEYVLLTVMSYDRYVAICHPLHYYVILNKKVCVLLVAMTWCIGMLSPASVIAHVSKLPFCKCHEINHIFCDLMPLLQCSCGDISKLEALILIEGILLGFPSFGLTASSYISIVVVIMKIRSAEGKRKAFSTCSSHVTVITLLYFSLFSMYFQPPSRTSLNTSKAVSLLNVMVIPMLNPLLYSLRNKEVKLAVKRLCRVQQMVTNQS